MAVQSNSFLENVVMKPSFLNRIYILFLMQNDPYFVSKKLVNYFSKWEKDLAGNR